MPLQLTRQSFRRIVQRSGLVSAAQLDRIDRDHAESTATAQSLSEFLVDHGDLTPWQAQKLLQAKHRGFHLGRFQLQSKLARGGMSTIYTAVDGATGEDCVLKVLPLSRVAKASYLPRFQREARITCGLDHENVIRVYGLYCESDGTSDVHFMAMERLHGENLAEKVKREGPLPVRLAAELVQQAANGLAYAHQAGLVHRDVKPANFVLTTDGVIKVLDLGLASLDCGEEDDLTRQYDERVLGTADYLSPEQAVDSHEADARADIYSLGCTLYFLLAGHPPFPGGLLAQRILAHQTRKPAPVSDKRPDVPPAFEAILEGMLEKDRQQRTQKAEFVANQLGDWLTSNSEAVRFDQVPEPVESREAGEEVDQHSAPTNSHTDTQPLERRVSQAAEGGCPQNGIYTPEFEMFLKKLDEETGMRAVVDDAVRDQQLRSMSQLRPE